MKKMWLAGAAMLAGLSGFAGAAYAQTRSEGSDVSADVQTRGRINEGDTLNGNVDPAGDRDWYRIRLQANRSYNFTLNSAAEGGIDDPFLELVGPNGGDPVAFNDDGDESLNSVLRFTATETGNYYLVARGFNEASTGAYALGVEYLAPPTASARLAFGQPVQGDISASGEKDYYSVRLAAGQTYRFTLVGGDDRLNDPFLSIYAPGGVDPINMDDDGGGGLNSYLQFTAETAGDYILEARSFDETSTGAYTIAALQGDIPGDATTDIAFDVAGDGRADALAPAGDTDWYRIDLAEGQTIRVRLNAGGFEDDHGHDHGPQTGGATPPGALGDPYLNIRDARGEIVASDDDGGGELNSYLEFTAPSAGAYFIEARGFTDDAAGEYTLTLAPGDIPNDASTDETLSADISRQSRVNPAGDADWFGLSTIEGRTYRIFVEGGEGEGVLADPMVTLVGPDGAEIASDDDGGTGLSARLEFTAPSYNAYYVAVGGIAESTGAYSIRMVESEVRGDSGTDETLAGETDDRTSAIGFPDDRDAYRIVVEAGGSYTISVTAAETNGLGDPVLTILDQNGQEIASNDDIEPNRRRQNLNSRVTITAPEGAEQVLAVVGGMGGSTGAYTIDVRRAPQARR